VVTYQCQWSVSALHTSFLLSGFCEKTSMIELAEEVLWYVQLFRCERQTDGQISCRALYRRRAVIMRSYEAVAWRCLEDSWLLLVQWRHIPRRHPTLTVDSWWCPFPSQSTGHWSASSLPSHYRTSPLPAPRARSADYNETTQLVNQSINQSIRVSGNNNE